MARGVIRRETLDRLVPLQGGPTHSAFLKERQTNLRAPGFPDMKKDGEGGGGSSGGGSGGDAVRSLLGNFKEKKKDDRDAMYQVPDEVWRTRNESDAREQERENLPSSSSSQPVPALLYKSTSNPMSTTLARTKSAPVPPMASGSGSKNNTTAPRPPPAPLPLPRQTAAGPRQRPALTIQASFDRLPILTKNGPTLVNRHPLDPVMDRDTTYEPDFVMNPTIVPAGTFKVVLVCDTREVGEKIQGKRTEIMEALKAKGVEVDRKMLPLGDMIWVARRIGRDDEETREDDIVLDAIVERKRLDDLCNSIMDGRYTAQKVRLPSYTSL